MADLMPHDTREFSLVIKGRQNSPREIDITPGRGEGIHHRGIKNFEMVSQIGPMGQFSKALANAIQIGSQLPILIEAILADDLEIRFLAELDLIGFAQKHELLSPGHWILRTGENP
jgi:hypothetical protein